FLKSHGSIASTSFACGPAHRGYVLNRATQHWPLVACISTQYRRVRDRECTKLVGTDLVVTAKMHEPNVLVSAAVPSERDNVKVTALFVKVQEREGRYHGAQTWSIRLPRTRLSGSIQNTCQNRSQATLGLNRTRENNRFAIPNFRRENAVSRWINK